MKRCTCGSTEYRCTKCGRLYTDSKETILDILYESSEPIYGTILADLTGYSTPRVYQILNGMIHSGLVESAGKRRGYRLTFYMRGQLESARRFAVKRAS